MFSTYLSWISRGEKVARKRNLLLSLLSSFGSKRASCSWRSLALHWRPGMRREILSICLCGKRNSCLARFGNISNSDGYDAVRLIIASTAEYRNLYWKKNSTTVGSNSCSQDISHNCINCTLQLQHTYFHRIFCTNNIVYIAIVCTMGNKIQHSQYMSQDNIHHCLTKCGSLIRYPTLSEPILKKLSTTVGNNSRSQDISHTCINCTLQL